MVLVCNKSGNSSCYCQYQNIIFKRFVSAVYCKALYIGNPSIWWKPRERCLGPFYISYFNAFLLYRHSKSRQIKGLPILSIYRIIHLYSWHVVCYIIIDVPAVVETYNCTCITSTNYEVFYSKFYFIYNNRWISLVPTTNSTWLNLLPSFILQTEFHSL